MRGDFDEDEDPDFEPEWEAYDAQDDGKPMKPKEQKALDAIADTVLAYRPKARSKPARRRKRRANKIAKEK